jgi:hypothetical protein
VVEHLLADLRLLDHRDDHDLAWREVVYSGIGLSRA